jgi:hypothetical protein
MHACVYAIMCSDAAFSPTSSICLCVCHFLERGAPIFLLSFLKARVSSLTGSSTPKQLHSERGRSLSRTGQICICMQPEQARTMTSIRKVRWKNYLNSQCGNVTHHVLLKYLSPALEKEGLHGGMNCGFPLEKCPQWEGQCSKYMGLIA